MLRRYQEFRPIELTEDVVFFILCFIGTLTALISSLEDITNNIEEPEDRAHIENETRYVRAVKRELQKVVRVGEFPEEIRQVVQALPQNQERLGTPDENRFEEVEEETHTFALGTINLMLEEELVGKGTKEDPFVIE